MSKCQNDDVLIFVPLMWRVLAAFAVIRYRVIHRDANRRVCIRRKRGFIDRSRPRTRKTRAIKPARVCPRMKRALRRIITG